MATMPGMVNNMATGMSQPKSAFSIGGVNIGGSVGQTLDNVSNTVNQVGQGLGNVQQWVSQNVPGALGVVNPLSDGASPPPAPPPVNPALTTLQTQQQTNATNFRNNIPQMEQQMGEQLKASTNQTMGQQMGAVNSYNSSRGMGYGGVNQGQQQRVRSAAQTGVAQGQSNINAGLQNAANTLDAEAVNTGLGIQQTQQQIQNQIYSQAVSQMNTQNTLVGGVLGTGLLAGLVLA